MTASGGYRDDLRAVLVQIQRDDGVSLGLKFADAVLDALSQFLARPEVRERMVEAMVATNAGMTGYLNGTVLPRAALDVFVSELGVEP